MVVIIFFSFWLWWCCVFGRAKRGHSVQENWSCFVCLIIEWGSKKEKFYESYEGRLSGHTQTLRIIFFLLNDYVHLLVRNKRTKLYNSCVNLGQWDFINNFFFLNSLSKKKGLWKWIYGLMKWIFKSDIKYSIVHFGEHLKEFEK